MLSQDKIEEIVSEDPEKEHKEVKARLRKYELDFEARQGFKPRKRDEWGKMWPEYEKYVVLRKAANEAREKKGEPGGPQGPINEERMGETSRLLDPEAASSSTAEAPAGTASTTAPEEHQKRI